MGGMEIAQKEYSSITFLVLVCLLLTFSQKARSMKIAQVAPLFESVPPHGYGGTERVVSYLTEELVRQGHQVTLFASGDSVTQARLVAACARSLRLDPAVCGSARASHCAARTGVSTGTVPLTCSIFTLTTVHFPLSVRQHIPTVTTLHGRLDLPDLVPLYQMFPAMPVVSISDAQRAPLPWVNWLGTVYHGLPADLYTFRETPGTYLAFLGRIAPEKGVEQAIAIAQQVGMPLKIAAKVDRADREYFREVVQPLLHKSSLVEYVGEVGGDTKDAFLGEAYALLFPIDWPEPFGLVMIEAMACGTPVIAYPRGSVPEVLEDGVTGWIVEGMEEAVQAVERVPALSRARCRQVFEARFSASRMAQDYVKLYRQLLAPQAGRVAA